MPELTFFKVMDVSTGHLTPSERRDLWDGSLEYQVMHGDDGGLLWVCSEIVGREFAAPEVMSETQLAILRLAYESACDYVKYDRDGTELNGFPIYDDDGQPVEP